MINRKRTISFLCPAVITFGIWAASPVFFGIVEPWDTPTPFYSAASLLGGALLALAYPVLLLHCFLGAWAGQIVALLVLPGVDRGWFLLGVISTGIGSLVFFAGALLGGWLRRKAAA